MSHVKMITMGEEPRTTSDTLSETDAAVTGTTVGDGSDPSISLKPYSECRQMVQDARSAPGVTNSPLTVLGAALSTAKLPITFS